MVITVRTDGTVQFESFKKTLGHGLDEKAREAVEKWTFTPAKKDGIPVATIVTISTNFSLR
jgi:TonB family protein